MRLRSARLLLAGLKYLPLCITLKLGTELRVPQVLLLEAGAVELDACLDPAVLQAGRAAFAISFALFSALLDPACGGGLGLTSDVTAEGVLVAAALSLLEAGVGVGYFQGTRGCENEKEDDEGDER